MAEAQLVVELLHVELVVFPEFGGALSGHVFDFLPFVLEGLDGVILFVGLVGRYGCGLDGFDDFEFAAEVVLFFLFCCLKCFGTEFANEGHFGFEGRLVHIGLGHIFFDGTASSHEGVACGSSLGVVQAVVHLLECFEFAAGHVASRLCDFAQAFDDSLLRIGQYEHGHLVFGCGHGLEVFFGIIHRLADLGGSSFFSRFGGGHCGCFRFDSFGHKGLVGLILFHLG